MLEIKGKVHNGTVLPLEPISDNYEGKEVIITLTDEPESENQNGWKRLMEIIEENQIEWTSPMAAVLRLRKEGFVFLR